MPMWDPCRQMVWWEIFLKHSRCKLCAVAALHHIRSEMVHLTMRASLLKPCPRHEMLMMVSCWQTRNCPQSQVHTIIVRKCSADDLNSLEGEPNWELTSQRSNRFYLPNATGPAWQGDTSTVGLMEPLAHLVNFFKDDNVDKSRLEFACCQCPVLIRDSIFEQFPVRAIGQRDYAITLLTLSYEGDIEKGAAKVSACPHTHIHTEAFTANNAFLIYYSLCSLPEK